MKPFLKWVGGKTQILEDVLEMFPTEVNDYYEPFVGGGSVLLAFLTAVKDKKITCSGTVYASDINSNLIAVYKNIQTRCDDVIVFLTLLREGMPQSDRTVVNRNPTTPEEAGTSQESYYYWIRSQYNNLSEDVRQSTLASAMFLFLNKTCFRGLYREGPRGFNVPYGNYKNPTILDADHLRAVSNLIQNVVFVCESYADALVNVKENDFVYMDPPYAPENATSFVSYTAHGFKKEDHETLFQLCRTLPCKFLMSNSDVELVRNSFPEELYNVKTVSCRRAIHSTNPESRTNEVLITNVRET